MTPPPEAELLAIVRDLFVAFVIIDGTTAGKGGETSLWFARQIAQSFPSRFGETDVLALAR